MIDERMLTVEGLIVFRSGVSASCSVKATSTTPQGIKSQGNVTKYTHLIRGPTRRRNRNNDLSDTLKPNIICKVDHTKLKMWTRKAKVT